MENTVKERLIEFLRFEKINMSEFARRINVSNSYVNGIRQSIQPDKVERIAINFPDLNIEWLLTGKGKMLKSDDTDSSNINIGNNSESLNITELIRQHGELIKQQGELIDIIKKLSNQLTIIKGE